MLPWYWMGFATPRIVVEAGALRVQIIHHHSNSSSRSGDSCQHPTNSFNDTTTTTTTTTTERRISLTAEQITFWDTLYGNVLLEFMYVNKLMWRVPTLEIIPGETADDERGKESGWYSPSEGTEDDHINYDLRVLLPLGGGKDSLVAWHLCQSEDRLQPVLMYVCDGDDEYDRSWRLQGLVHTNTTS